MADPDAIPGWVQRLAVATWVSGPDRKIRYTNERARALLDVSAERCLGATCHELVAASDRSGQNFCAHTCPLRRTIESGAACEPVALQVRGSWVLLAALPLGRDERCSVVHFALDAGKALRMEDYLDRVAHQDGFVSRAAWSERFRALTKRHREMLELLSADESPASIARLLHRSILTVRNHIQHLLETLGVHSVPQAVALFLLYGDGREPAPNEAGSPAVR